MWLLLVTDGSPHHEAWGGACVSWANALRRWCSPGLCHTHIHPSLTYRKKLLSSQKTTECHSTLQSTLSWHQSSCAWWCHSVCGSLARGTHDLSPTANRQFPMVLGDTAGATCVRISPLDAVQVATAARTMRRSWRATVLCGHPEFGLWVWECSRDHCWKQHATNTLCPTCAAICQYVHPASMQAYNATPFKCPNCNNRCKMLGTIYRRMTFSTVMTVCMQEYMPSLPLEGATLCIQVTVWAALAVTCVFHLVWICYHILLQW